MSSIHGLHMREHVNSNNCPVCFRNCVVQQHRQHRISFPVVINTRIGRDVILDPLCGCSSRQRIQNHIPANAGVYDDGEGYAVLSMLLNNAVPETHGAIIRINMITNVESVNGTHSLEDCMKIPEEFREAANDYERSEERR